MFSDSKHNSCYRYTFASGSPDNIKQWKFPDGNFIQNLSGHSAIINTLAVNSDGVLVSGGTVGILQVVFIWLGILVVQKVGEVILIYVY